MWAGYGEWVLSWRVGDEIAESVTMVATGSEGLVKLGVLDRSLIGRRYGRYPPLRRILKGVRASFGSCTAERPFSGYARIPKKQYEHLL